MTVSNEKQKRMLSSYLIKTIKQMDLIRDTPSIDGVGKEGDLKNNP